MSIRTLMVDGVPWTVWDVVPNTAPAVDPGLLREELRQGWLCMERRGEKRRIVPAPADWEEWDDARLAQAVREASPIPLRDAGAVPRPLPPA